MLQNHVFFALDIVPSQSRDQLVHRSSATALWPEPRGHMEL